MNFYTNPHTNFIFKTKLRQKMKNEPRSPLAYGDCQKASN